MHVIAEAGNNHNGDVETAKKLIDVAKEAGADSVKFQVINPEGLYLAELPIDDGYEENEVIAARRAHQLSDDDYRELAGYCDEVGITFSASVFDPEGIELLDGIGVDYIKIASCDLTHAELISTAIATGRRVILSTGMATYEEVERTLGIVDPDRKADLVLLHCVSVYPAKLEQMNLPFLDELAKFGYPVGLSDHTPTPVASAMALTKGATWVEKHFTLDRTQEGFDHAYALEPDGLKELVETLDAAGQALDSDDPKLGEQELSVAERARRSLYASRDISAGETLSREDILVRRPAGPLEPTDLDELIGGELGAPLRKYEAFSWESIGR